MSERSERPITSRLVEVIDRVLETGVVVLRIRVSLAA